MRRRGNEQEIKSELLSACEAGDLLTVKRLSARAVKIRQIDGPLHKAAREGHLEIVKYLIKEAHCDPSTEADGGWTPLHYACKGGHLNTVKYLVEEAACNSNIRGNGGWTPLHWACREGRLEVVLYLVGVANCDSSAQSNDGRTPLHWACQRGDLEVVKYLSSHCDPNISDDSRQTPLHWACKKGNLEVVRYLLKKAHCHLNPRDNNGSLPFHLACQNDKEDVVKSLLEEFHSNPNTTTKGGQTPLSLTTNTAIIKLLLAHGAVVNNLFEYASLLPDGSPRKPAQSNVSAFMLGDKGAGKSTLTKAITTQKYYIVRLFGLTGKVSSVKERTAGIESHVVRNSRLGHLIIYDMAGHREYHNSHDTVIRNSMSQLSIGIFLLVINLTSMLGDMKRTIFYWLSFIQSQVNRESTKRGNKPYLIAVGSHADSLEPRQLVEKEMIIRGMCSNLANVVFVDYVGVDCRYGESSSLSQLRAYILATHDKIQHRIPKVTFRDHCFHIYLVSECGNKPGIQLKNLLRSIKTSTFFSKDFLPQTMKALHKVCSNLNKRGVMLYIQTQNIETNWIIIDKDLLLREVNGSVFSPADFTEHKPLTQTGVVPLSKIRSAFAELIESSQLDPQLIVDFLVHMEFCRQISEGDLLNLMVKGRVQYKDEPHYLFPSLTQQKSPPDIWKPRSGEYHCCWILQCQDSHYLSPRLQQVLILRLAFEHSVAHREEPTSPALHQFCSIWKSSKKEATNLSDVVVSGLQWTTESSDVMVEITDTSIALYLSCNSVYTEKDKLLKLVHTRSQVISQIMKAKAEFCGDDMKTVEEFIDKPQYPVNITSSSKIPVEEIAEAICSGKRTIQPILHHLVSISDLLGFEPLQFCKTQALVDLYSESHISCEVTSSVIDFTNISSDDLCKLLDIDILKRSSDVEKVFDEWQNETGGTYQCLRKQIDKYSIFSGRNILEAARSLPDPLPSPSPIVSECDGLPKPTRRSLYIHAKVTKPYELGLHLGLSNNDLDYITVDHPQDHKEQLFRLFKLYLHRAEDPSWTEVEEALYNMGEKRLAKEIREQFDISPRNTEKIPVVPPPLPVMPIVLENNVPEPTRETYDRKSEESQRKYIIIILLLSLTILIVAIFVYEL